MVERFGSDDGEEVIGRRVVPTTSYAFVNRRKGLALEIEDFRCVYPFVF